MKVRQKPTIIFLSLSSIVMMLTLAWLTISLPFVYVAQQTVEQNKYSNCDSPVSDNEEENDNPLAGTTEEKTSKNINSMSEEYLHDSHTSEQYLATVSKEYKVKQATTYIAFYGELISPPPDAA